MAAMGLDELADCVSLGEIKTMLCHFDKLVSSGASPIVILNNLSRHFQKLRLVLSSEGAPAQNIFKLTPPIHFTRKDRFLRQCRLWNLAGTTKALDILWNTNRALRSSNPEVVCIQALMFLTLRAQRQANRQTNR
jgi:DNA polymerase III delta subunit